MGILNLVVTHPSTSVKELATALTRTLSALTTVPLRVELHLYNGMDWNLKCIGFLSALMGSARRKRFG
jgi:hypothetical protein